ncbi:hypothetical protein ACIRU8_39410 [Streptomyces sp. NPDC101175]|uniref:hypothetical protein n=1 Tax=Streptomyces sp. NPDC101175 TaxID=3366123 RepID=UPI0038345E72
MSEPRTVPITDAVAVALDSIGDDPDYATARRMLRHAECMLANGTTEQATEALERALAELDAACPL